MRTRRDGSTPSGRRALGRKLRPLGLVLVPPGGTRYAVRRAGDPRPLTVIEGGRGGTDVGPGGDETGGDRTRPGRP